MFAQEEGDGTAITFALRLMLCSSPSLVRSLYLKIGLLLNKSVIQSAICWGIGGMSAQRTHEREKLGSFATIGNILADTNHSTAPQCWTAPALDVNSFGEICTS